MRGVNRGGSSDREGPDDDGRAIDDDGVAATPSSSMVVPVEEDSVAATAVVAAVAEEEVASVVDVGAERRVVHRNPIVVLEDIVIRPPQSGALPKRDKLGRYVRASCEEEMDTASVSSSRRAAKRPLEAPFGYDSSESEVAAAAPKIGTARRGGCRTRAFLKKKALEEVKAYEDFASRGQSDLDWEDSEAESCHGAAPRAEALATDAGRAEAMAEVRRVRAAVDKSRNLKGTTAADIKDGLSEIEAFIDLLASRTITAETKRLMADNARLTQEAANMKAENSALRRALSERPRPSAAAAPALQTDIGADVVEELMRSLTKVNARMESLEMRLPPEPIMRPPLAADRKRAALAQVAAAPPAAPSRTYAVAAGARAPAPAARAARTPAPAQPRAPRAAQAGASRWVPGTGPPARQAAAKLVPVPAPAPRPAPAPAPKPAAKPGSRKVTPRAPTGTSAAQPAQSEGWTVVEGATQKRRKRRQRQRARQTAAKASAGAQPKTAIPPRPQSTAVVLTLRAAALERGVTYPEVIARARRQLTLEELEIDGVHIRETAAGARILEVPGAASDEKADRLASRLREVLGEDVVVARPTKCVELRISDLDDSVEVEEVHAAVVARGQCPAEQVRVYAIATGPDGRGAVVVRCPIVVAKAVVATKFRVGWSTARVKVLESLPMRCYRCMGIGHVGRRCPVDSDRSNVCFRCGEPGHRAATCKKEPKCAVCAELGRPAAHIMGGKACRPPPTKAKEAPGKRASSAAKSAPMEETEMSLDA